MLSLIKICYIPTIFALLHLIIVMSSEQWNKVQYLWLFNDVQSMISYLD